jgi:hypothetical protein
MWKSKPNKLPYQGNKKLSIGLIMNCVILETTAVGKHGVEQRETFVQLRPALVHNIKKLCPVQIMIGQKQLETFEHFNCLDTVITNDSTSVRGIKCNISMTKAIFKNWNFSWQENLTTI